jgi:hypothetical protein
LSKPAEEFRYNAAVSREKSRWETKYLELKSSTSRRTAFWVLAGEQEYFLSYDEFPWFKQASVAAILNVREEGAGNFYWPEIDVDLLPRLDSAFGALSAEVATRRMTAGARRSAPPTRCLARCEPGQM